MLKIFSLSLNFTFIVSLYFLPKAKMNSPFSKVLISTPSIKILSFLLAIPVISPPSQKQPNKFGNSSAKV